MRDPFADPPQDAILGLDLRYILEVHERIMEVVVDGKPHAARLERLGLEPYEQARLDNR